MVTVVGVDVRVQRAGVDQERDAPRFFDRFSCCAATLFITRLPWSLAGQTMTVHLRDDAIVSKA